MTKKPTDKNQKPSSDVKAQAMAQMRKTRDKINEEHPKLLSSLRNQLDAMQKPAPNAPVWAKNVDKAAEKLDDRLKIDRKKNLESIMKFLEVKRGHSQNFQDKLKDVLRDTDL